MPCRDCEEKGLDDCEECAEKKQRSRDSTLEIIWRHVMNARPEHKKDNGLARAYIAGPMRGIPDFNFPAFDALAEELRDKGWSVFSPADRDRERGDAPDPNGENAKHLSYYMVDDLPAVAACDAVFLLPGWEQSRGASLEFFVAKALDIPCFDADTMLWADHSVNQEASESSPELEEIERHVSPGVVYIPLYEYESETRIVDSGTGGQKGQKLARFDLIPADALQALARHYGVGALKYEDDNWLKGYDWKLSLGAAGRHLNAFHRGESAYVERFVGHDGVTYEVETHHLIALAWQAFTLWVFDTTGLGVDSRRPC